MKEEDVVGEGCVVDVELGVRDILDVGVQLGV